MKTQLFFAAALSALLVFPPVIATAATEPGELGPGREVTTEVVVGATADPFSPSTSPMLATAGAFEAERALILQQTNSLRAENALPALRLNSALNNIAQDWSMQQASVSAMSHRPNFHLLYPSGWTSASENVAAGYSPNRVVDAWAGSPGHRANLLSSSTDIGIGVATNSAGRFYYTQNFARYPSAPPLAAPQGYSFYDVPPGSTFAQEIEWLASTGVTTGYSDFTFRPTGSVKRDAMAAFLYRFAGQPAFTPPTVSPFVDMGPSTQFYREVTWLASTGVSTGFPDGTFRPTQPVSRDAMAAFLYRFAGQPTFTAPGVSPFTDVTPSSQFYREIMWLASTGVTTGYSDGSFRAGQSVNRDAMAAFLFRFDDRGFVAGVG